MGAFEKFLHREHEELPILVKAALVHVQFETIHPFLDGNGRLGRLLITLLLCVAGAIREPILYLSLYFKTHRQHYYELLDRVSDFGRLGNVAGVFPEWRQGNRNTSGTERAPDPDVVPRGS